MDNSFHWLLLTRSVSLLAFCLVAVRMAIWCDVLVIESFYVLTFVLLTVLVVWTVVAAVAVVKVSAAGWR